MIYFMLDGTHVCTEDHYDPEPDGRVLAVVGDRGYTWLQSGQWSKEPLPGKPSPVPAWQVAQHQGAGEGWK